MPVSIEPKSPEVVLEDIDASSDEKSKKLNTNLSTDMFGEDGVPSPVSSYFMPPAKMPPKKLST